MKRTRTISYENRHEQLVEVQIEKLSLALYYANETEQANILFCLDKYLDPYYGYHLHDEADIILLQQHLCFEHNSGVDTKEDILDLLSYSTQPFSILEKNLNKLSGN